MRRRHFALFFHSISLLKRNWAAMETEAKEFGATDAGTGGLNGMGGSSDMASSPVPAQGGDVAPMAQ